MKLRSLIFSSLFVVLTETVAFADAQCPGNATPVRYHSLEHSQIGVDVTINGQGPFEFMLDTGAQITILEPSLAEELNLKAAASIGVVAVASYSKADLVVPDVIQTGSASVSKPLAAVHDLSQIQASNPKVRGLLGDNFLGRFDLLIDNGRKMVCLDETTQMQQALTGERIQLLTPADRQSNLPFTQPVLIKVHLPGDGPAGTIMRVDSGSNAPLLFASHSDTLPWLQRASARPAGVANGALSLAVAPPQEVRIGTRTSRQIAFLTPIGTGRNFAKAGEDGLLPTTLFKRVFISCRDGLVMFDPR